MADMLSVLCHYMIVQHRTWQDDYTAINILQVAVKYHLFREGRENALNIFNQFFNRVLKVKLPEYRDILGMYERSISRIF